MVPLNYAPVMWGWPNRFLGRMGAAGSEVFVAGGLSKAGGMNGIDTVEEFRRLPQGYAGGIRTDEIGTIGPLVKRISN